MPSGRDRGGRVRIDAPCEEVCRLQVIGVLDGDTGARTLRCVDARLQLATAGHRPARHLLIDLSEVITATVAGVRALPHAHYAAGRRAVSLHLIGAGHLCSGLSPAASGPLRGLGGFPDLPAALASLHPHCSRCAPV